MIRHIVFRILGRTTRLGVGIDTEHGVVAGLARPHPVVSLATEFTHRLGDSKHESHILEVAIGGQIVFIAFVKRLHLHAQGRILQADALAPGILNGINESAHFLNRQFAESELVERIGDILLINHKAHEEILVRQFLGKRLGIETIQQVVVLHR